MFMVGKAYDEAAALCADASNLYDLGWEMESCLDNLGTVNGSRYIQLIQWTC